MVPLPILIGTSIDKSLFLHFMLTYSSMNAIVVQSFVRGRHMKKKSDIEETESERNRDTIWCSDGEIFQYIKVCEADCKKKDRCKPFRDYFEPISFKV
jgi:hypothetical protein